MGKKEKGRERENGTEIERKRRENGTEIEKGRERERL